MAAHFNLVISEHSCTLKRNPAAIAGRSGRPLHRAHQRSRTGTLRPQESTEPHTGQTLTPASMGRYRSDVSAALQHGLWPLFEDSEKVGNVIEYLRLLRSQRNRTVGPREENGMGRKW
jgi:hypothetical protein